MSIFVGFVKFNLRLPMPRVENEHGTKLRKNLSQLLLLEKVDLKLELKTFETLEHRVCGTSHVHDCRGQDTFFTW